MIQNIKAYSISFFLLIFLVSRFESIAQNKKRIDSLQILLNQAKEDTNKVNLYFKLIQNIGMPNPTYFEYASSALDLSKKLDFFYGEVRACFALSKYHESTGNLIKAMELISHGLIQSQKTNDAKLKVSCRRQLDDIYNKSNYSKETQLIYTNTIDKMQDDTVKVKTINSFNSNDDDAHKIHLDYADRSLALCERLDYTKGKTEVYGFLTNYYLDFGNDHRKAIWAANKALEMARMSKNRMDEAKSLGIIGQIYSKEELYRECTNYNLASLSISSLIKDTSSQFLACLALGNSYVNLGFNFLDSSIFYLEKAGKIVDDLYIGSELLEDISREELRAVVNQNLGISYLNKKDTINGNKYIRSSSIVMSSDKGYFSGDSLGKIIAYSSLAYLSAVKSNRDSTLYYLIKKISTLPLDFSFYAGDLKGISEIYFEKGEYKKAYEFLDRSFRVNDSITKLKSKSDIQDILIKYQTAEKEKKIIELNKNNLIGESELKTSRAINTAAISALALIVLGLFFTWYFYQNKRKTEQLVSEKKEISALLEGQEIERQRIAADLHDRLGSMLATVKLYFNSVEENIEQLKRENRVQYNKASSLLDEACEEVRKISHDLASGVLVKLGLVAALNELKETVTKSNQLSMELFCFGLDKRLPAEMEVNIYRIIQELLSNTLKHAKASKISIQLNKTENNLNIIIEDNGIGFDPEILKNKDGIGLKNVRERVTKMNGTLDIDAKGGVGAIFILNIPVPV